MKSATHSSSGRSAVKSRSTRSGLRVAAGSAIVVRHGLPRRLAPWMPCGAHQPLDVVAADALAGALQRLPHPAVAVGVVVGGVRPRGSRSSSRSSSIDARRALRRWRGGSRRTPTRPGPGRSARRRSGRGAHRCSGSPRSVLVELLREKHRRGFQDLVRATQLEVLRAQLADLLTLRASSADPAARRYRPRPGAPSCAASRGGCPRSRATCAIGRPLSSASRTPRCDQLIGVLLRTGHEIGGSPSSRTRSWIQGLRQTQPASQPRVPSPSQSTEPLAGAAPRTAMQSE